MTAGTTEHATGCSTSARSIAARAGKLRCAARYMGSASVIGAFLLAGCATMATSEGSLSVAASAADRFAIAGRLSARHGNDGVSGNFSWERNSGIDRIEVGTPLGQTVARLTGAATGVQLERPGEAVVEFSDWNAVTREVFGVAIPVEGLANWIRGSPAVPANAGVELDAQGRLTVLREDGWEIVYAYADRLERALPIRLVMRYPDVELIEIRIVIDRRMAPLQATP